MDLHVDLGQLLILLLGGCGAAIGTVTGFGVKQVLHRMDRQDKMMEAHRRSLRHVELFLASEFKFKPLVQKDDADD